MPPHREFDHEIHIENDQTPPHSHIYLLSGTELSLLCEFLDDMLIKGFIRSSQSRRCPSPLCKEKGWHPATLSGLPKPQQDHPKDQFTQFPSSSNLLDQLGSVNVYTQLDLRAWLLQCLRRQRATSGRHLPNALWLLRVPGHANGTYQCSHYVPSIHEPHLPRHD